PRNRGPRLQRRAFTLVELMTAMALALIVMSVITSYFGQVTEAINEHRTTMNMRSQLRASADRLRADLEGVTVRSAPPITPEHNEGYLEIIEGPLGAWFHPYNRVTPVPMTTALDPNLVNNINNAGFPNYDWDSTLGDLDDWIMFPTRSHGEPFTGRISTPGGAAGAFIAGQSQVAEIAWFVRGTTLYRRVHLVRPRPVLNGGVGYQTQAWTSGAPNAQAGTALSANFYQHCDVSVRQVVDPNGGPPQLIPNTLKSLTDRQNRFAHDSVWPHDVRAWGALGMPTLGECTDGVNYYDPASTPPFNVTPLTSQGTFDARGIRVDSSPFPFTQFQSDPEKRETGELANSVGNPNSRIGEDVVMRNVLAFDVKVWDPGAPVYEDANGEAVIQGDPDYLTDYVQAGVTPISFGSFVDLNYMGVLGNYPAVPNAPVPHFNSPGDQRSGLQGQTPGNPPQAAVYDTSTTSYERDGFDQDGQFGPDSGTNFIDDNNSGGPDDVSERESPPPYDVPLRGIKITIRVFDPDSDSVREFSVVQDFVLE
ncbi:MAG: prepilin-type N-terminal cleavage/methylation domain-containing protein, partial [Planctomycetales bacterium]